jgi:glycosyltransferase involved in cell wall biosynthesis
MQPSGHEGQRDHDAEDQIGGRGLDPDDRQEQHAQRDRGVVTAEREGKRPEQSHPEAHDDRQRKRGSAECNAQRQEEGEERGPSRRPRYGGRGLDPAANPDELGGLHRPASGAHRRRPRLLLVITLAEVGGAQTYVASLLPALVGHFDVAVAAHGPGPLCEAAGAAGVRFHPLQNVRRPISLWRDLAGLYELTRLLRRERPDILHASSSKAGVLGRLAGFFARVPVRIFTVHGWAFAAHSGFSSRLYRWLDRLVEPLTTVTICVSERERAAGLAAGTCARERTVVIPNAVDVEGAPRSRPVERERPLILAVGRLKAPKDFPTLIRALGDLRPDSFEAVIVGDGPDRPRLEEEIETLGLTGPVRLAGERRDVPELLAAADVFVLPSVSEGLPVSVLEAMAAGLPVVASRVGGVPEQVSDGQTGLLVEPGDPNALAAALARLIAEPSLRRRLGAAGRARAEQAFDLDPFRRAHVELYSRELARRRLPAPTP